VNQRKVYYKDLVGGVVMGAFITSLFFAHALLQPRECEPVVDVEYKRSGKKLVPETVVRKPVRDGKRCLLAEAG